MINKDIFDRMVAQTKEVAERSLTEPGDALPPLVGVFKDEQVHLWVWPEPGAENLLKVAWPIITGMEPDFITIVHDSLRVSTTNSVTLEDGTTAPAKRDGTPWGPGEMQKAREEGTEDAQDVVDTLMVYYFDRLGQAAMVSLDYSYGESGLVWGEVLEAFDSGLGDEKVRASGYIPENIREMFTRPTVREMMIREAELEEELSEVAWMSRFVMGGAAMMSPAEALAYTEEHPREAYAHMVCAMLKATLIPMGVPVAVAVRDKAILEIYERSMADQPIDLMPVHSGPHPLADKEVIVHPHVPFQKLVDGARFRVQDWVDQLTDPPTGWRMQAAENPNWALKGYLHRLAEVEERGDAELLHTMTDPDVVYGHVVWPGNEHGLGYVVHASELGEEVH